MSDPITTAVDTVSWWSNLWGARDQIMGGGLAVIAAAAMVVGGTKTPAPGSWLGKIYKVIEWASLTFGKAKDTGEREKVVEEKVEEPK